MGILAGKYALIALADKTTSCLFYPSQIKIMPYLKQVLMIGIGLCQTFSTIGSVVIFFNNRPYLGTC